MDGIRDLLEDDLLMVVGRKMAKLEQRAMEIELKFRFY